MNLLFSCLRLNLHPPIVADGQIQLGYLVVLRVIRIKIILSVKFTVLMNVAIGGKAYSQGIFHHLPVQYRQGAWHPRADGTGVGVGRPAKFCGAPAENLCLCGQLHMDLQADHGLILSAHIPAPPPFSVTLSVIRPAADSCAIFGIS